MNSSFLIRGTLSPRLGVAASTGGRKSPSACPVKIAVPFTPNRVPSSIAVGKKGR